jgi:hypothetical protein
MSAIFCLLTMSRGANRIELYDRSTLTFQLAYGRQRRQFKHSRCSIVAYINRPNHLVQGKYHCSACIRCM